MRVSFRVAREKVRYFLFICVLKWSLLGGQKSSVLISGKKFDYHNGLGCFFTSPFSRLVFKINENVDDLATLVQEVIFFARDDDMTTSSVTQGYGNNITQSL